MLGSVLGVAAQDISNSAIKARAEDPIQHIADYLEAQGKAKEAELQSLAASSAEASKD